ncbi:hypothetical protein GGR57DRAFT_350899 [Xylariaceae sp. FL1272]|nr:hypothetical protein GGR57DRAFT_350899 [Xylariaceae sp. FL1272]
MARRLWYKITLKDFITNRNIWLFPLFAGSAWFLTLTILLIRWGSLGQPQYPGQVNPYVPFMVSFGLFALHLRESVVGRQS